MIVWVVEGYLKVFGGTLPNEQCYEIVGIFSTMEKAYAYERECEECSSDYEGYIVTRHYVDEPSYVF